MKRIAGIITVFLMCGFLEAQEGTIEGSGVFKAKKSGYSVNIPKGNRYRTVSDDRLEITIYNENGEMSALTIKKFTFAKKWDDAKKFFNTNLEKVVFEGEHPEPVPVVKSDDDKKMKKLNGMDCIIKMYTTSDGIKGYIGIFKTMRGVYQFHFATSIGGFEQSLAPVLPVIRSIKPILF